jgi:hypothetical protein
VTSLQDRKRSLANRNNPPSLVPRNRKAYLEIPDRLSELEQDMLKVVETCMDLDRELHTQRRITRQLIRLLRQAEVSVSEVSPTS